MKHICHAKGCTVPVPRKMLMCRRHWYMVPAKLRAAVWAMYSPGQEEGRAPIKSEWHDAADEAIQAVFLKEQQQEKTE